MLKTGKKQKQTQVGELKALKIEWDVVLTSKLLKLLEDNRQIIADICISHKCKGKDIKGLKPITAVEACAFPLLESHSRLNKLCITISRHKIKGLSYYVLSSPEWVNKFHIRLEAELKDLLQLLCTSS